MKRTHQHRGGLAMILVVVLMAAAAIMAFALLSSSSNQAQSGKNAVNSVSADGLVSSGTNLALYYLMYPDKVDGSLLSTSNGISYYNPGTTVPSMNMGSGSAVNNISVSMISKGNYNVDVTATASSNGATINRSTRSVVQVQSRYIPQYAMACNTSFTMPLTFLTSTVTGPVRCDGGYGGLLTAITGLLFGTSTQPLPTYPKQACPSYSQLDYCKNLPSYTVGTLTYRAQQLTSSNVDTGHLTGAVASTNPGNVYYLNGDGTISTALNFTGTIILTSGNSLTVNTNNATITAKPGYPALIVGKDVIFKNLGNKLAVNGVCWIGGNWTGTGTLPSGTLSVNGSLMWGGTSPKIDTSKLLGVTSRLVVTWPTSAATIDPPTPDAVYCPDLCDSDQTPKSVKVISTSILAH